MSTMRSTFSVPARLAAWPIAAAAMTACIPLPIPLSSEEYGRVPERIVTQIRPGLSNRADVLLLLGDPIVRGQDDAYFVYSWAYRHGGVAVVGLTGGGPFPLVDTQQYSCRALAVGFAATGQVDRSGSFEGSTRSVVSGIDSSTSLAALCRQDAELLGRIRTWLADSAPAGGLATPSKPARP